MKPGILVSIAVAICVMSISGCGTLSARNQADKLERSVTHYASALRWGRLQEAINYHMTQDGKSAEVNLEYLEQFSVTSLDVISKTIIPSAEKGGVTEADINFEMNYYHKEQGTVRKLKLNQVWWYSKKHNTWLIESDFPEFK